MKTVATGSAKALERSLREVALRVLGADAKAMFRAWVRMFHAGHGPSSAHFQMLWNRVAPSRRSLDLEDGPRITARARFQRPDEGVEWSLQLR
ncbi:MAG: hypothetical protein WCA77_05470 [Thermoplasmata archaeon]